MRKRSSYVNKYGDDKLYTALQTEAAYASVAARLKKKAAAAMAASQSQPLPD
jgi:hypothetical protein